MEKIDILATAKTHVERPPAPSQRVLVVDDEPLICRLNVEVLKEAGYDVHVAADGAAAWDALQQHDYDLVVTDNQMPKVSGMELVKKIREAKMELPVIMATGSLPDEAFTKHHWLPPFALLLKPYSLPELLELVKSVLHIHNGGSRRTVLVPNWECHPQTFGVRLS
jgi:DNA-binding response OmpR family regulator